MMGKSIIAVSDVHLGMIIGDNKPDSEKQRESLFMDFLDTLDFSKISDFVLLGDILDFWRHDYLNVIDEESRYVDKLRELKNKYTGTNFHYIAGNHDYHLIWLKENGADYPTDIKKSVVIKSKDKEFYFTHGYQLEVLSWKLYKSIPLYEEFCENMCLVGEDGSQLADNLWKHFFEKMSNARELSTDEIGTRKAVEPERLFEFYESVSDVTPKRTLEEIACKSEELLSQIESSQIELGEEVQNIGEKKETTRGGVSRGITATLLDIKEQAKDLNGKATDLNEKIEQLDQINPFDPPEKRIKEREEKMKDLKKSIEELSEQKEEKVESLKRSMEGLSKQREDTCRDLKGKCNLNSLFGPLRDLYELLRDLVIPKHVDYFTIEEIAESNSRHNMFGIKKDQYLIYGHTHKAYVNEDKKVANTGCWGIQNSEKRNLYIEIIDDKVTIMNFSK